MSRSLNYAQVIMEFDVDRKVFSMDFNGELKLYKLGSVGASAGRFVVDNSNTLSSTPQIWGVATIETNFSFLEQYGVFMFAKGTFQLNLTEHQKVETLTLRGLDGGADVTRTFTLAAHTFAIEMVGEARVRPLGTNTDLVKSPGLSISILVLVDLRCFLQRNFPMASEVPTRVQYYRSFSHSDRPR